MKFQTDAPVKPCDAKYRGAPSPAHDEKRAGKCTISKSPQCYRMQEHLLLIHSGIEDSKNVLLEVIASRFGIARRRGSIWHPRANSSNHPRGIVYYHYITEFKDEEQQSQYKQCDPLEPYDNAIHTVFDVSVGKPRGSYKHSQPSPDLH